MIASNEIQNDVLMILPKNARKILMQTSLEDCEEIRIRLNRRIAVVRQGKSILLGSGVMAREDINEAMTCLTGGAVCAYEKMIERGFITKYGFRIGISGSGVYEKGRLSYIKNICGLNYRIARQISGCADEVIKHIINGGVKNTLVVSPPGCGKTTLLRESARLISNAGFKTVVIDEREEIAASCESGFCFDVGENTDVLSGFDKRDAISIALRTLSPEVIICDELGGDDDKACISEASKRGASMLASIHSDSIENVSPDIRKLFSVFIFLGRSRGVGTVEVINCDG